MIIGTRKRIKEGEQPKPTRFYSTRQEESVAKAVGGKRTPNSGATDFGGKSDVDVANLFNIECKTKTSNSESISIKKEWLLKNKREATFDGNPYSAIAFNFGPDSNNYYIIEEYLFLELIDHLKTLDKPL